MRQPLNDNNFIEDLEPEPQPDFFTETKNLFQSYLGDRFTLVKLQVIEKLSVTAAAIVSGVLLAVFGLFFLIFVSVTLGFLFSHWLDSYAAGFGIVAGIYLLLILMVVLFGKRLFGDAVTQKIIQGFFKKK